MIMVGVMMIIIKKIKIIIMKINVLDNRGVEYDCK